MRNSRRIKFAEMWRMDRFSRNWLSRFMRVLREKVEKQAKRGRCSIIRPAGRAPIVRSPQLWFRSSSPSPCQPLFFLFNGQKPPRNLISRDYCTRACVRLNDSLLSSPFLSIDHRGERISFDTFNKLFEMHHQVGKFWNWILTFSIIRHRKIKIQQTLFDSLRLEDKIKKKGQGRKTGGTIRCYRKSIPPENSLMIVPYFKSLCL